MFYRQVPSHFLTAIFALLLLSCQTTETINPVYVGNQYAKDGLLREAAESYRKAIRLDQNNMAAHRNLGMVLVKASDYDTAEKHLKTAIKSYQSDFDTNFYLGEALRAQGNFADAIFHYKQALVIKPNQAKALKPLAWSYYKTRFYTEAFSVTRQLSKIARHDEQVSVIASRILIKLGRTDESLSILDSALRKAKPHTKAYLWSVQGDAYAAANNPKEALNSYRRALKQQPLLAGALLGLGKTLLSQNNSELATTYLERAVRLKPKHAEGHFYLARAYEKKNPKKAIKHYAYFRKQARMDPEYTELMTEMKRRVSALMPQRKQQKSR